MGYDDCSLDPLPSFIGSPIFALTEIVMHFHKQPTPFSLAPINGLQCSPPAKTSSATPLAEIANDSVRLTVRALVDGIFELTVNRVDSPLRHYTPPLASVPAVHPEATVEQDGSHIAVQDNHGAALHISTDRLSIGLTGVSKDGHPVPLITLDNSQYIGFNGDKFGVGLRMPEETPYYGFGEKTGTLNKHGQRMKFWNLDVCADVPDGCQTDHYDPTYCAIPVGIWSNTTEDGLHTAYCAVFIDNGGPAWFNCQTDDFREPDLFYFGTYSGEPRFYFITGPTMADVCAKLSRLTGTPKMPPLWSFANQQCRWGYDDERMYKRIIAQYEEDQIPLHGFWLDIDYMDEYQVFSWHEERVPSPEGLSKWMAARGVEMVTIVDPGVPTREDNATFVEGRAQERFCVAPSGELFVGMVWPGKTAFPDYSLPEVRQWWGNMIADHLNRGVAGIWNDMNDPATGMSDVDDMLFQHGQIEHTHFHNLYGTFMAEATWLGFRQHDPEKRPFILTRSASTGIQKYAAVWTGDNVSSWEHLRMSIPETLNLALSGVSFNGADIGGFMESTTAELLTRWYQAAVLFPFYRNHSNNGTAHQEPWCFGSHTRDVLRETINLRYRFLGLIYTAFAQHIQTGEPMVRPMCYFDSNAVYRDVSDQYAVGDDVVVAPVVEKDQNRRYVVLPEGNWFDLTNRTWQEGGNIFERDCAMDDVPIYVRDGAIIAEPVPLSNHDNPYVGWDCDLTKCDWRVHIFINPSANQNATASGQQLIDDGRTYVDQPEDALTMSYDNGKMAGSFPLDRVIELTVNGSADGPESLHADCGSVWNYQRETALPSVLRLMPANGEFKDHCRVYTRS